MENEDFRKHAHKLVDWMVDYLENIEQYPVKSQVEPGEIFNQIPDSPPTTGEPFENLFEDFQTIIMPGITHWQSPNFMAYFNGNASAPSVLGEMLTATLGTQCMIWQTSPAAAELEEKMMNWLKELLDLPRYWSGVIQDTASTATLCAILTAREKATYFQINKNGFPHNKFKVYCSTETHSSIDKAVKIAGLGANAIVKIEVDENLALIPEKLQQAITNDTANGYLPLIVIGTIGTTSTTAIDPIKAIGEICMKEKVWFHVDAAYAGTALIIPEMRWMSEGLEFADSFVFNPHKWMMVNFDCSAYFVKDEVGLVKTFEILPEYLKTKETNPVKNYRDWGIQLGRRFRALKLWFVLRSYGANGLRDKISSDLKLAQTLLGKMKEHDSFEILAPIPINVICFRYKPVGISDESDLNSINERLLETLNKTGRIYLTHTKIRGKYTIRIVLGQTSMTAKHVDAAWELIQHTAKNIQN